MGFILFGSDKLHAISPWDSPLMGDLKEKIRYFHIAPKMLN
jgi:hypothetical protein